jgi:SecD/SecF fusion protein
VAPSRGARRGGFRLIRATDILTQMAARTTSPLSGTFRRLSVIALLIGASGCGGDDPEPASQRDACGAKVQELDGPTVRLTYRGSDDVVADIPDLCKRLLALKVPTVVEGSGPDRVVMSVPAAAAPSAKFAARSGRLAFYDWEANVIGPSGAPAPTDIAVTGGVAAGRTGALDHYEAVVRAAKRPPSVEADSGRKGSLFYAVDRAASKVYGSGSATRAAALAVVPSGERGRAKVLEVNPGTVILAGERRLDVANTASGSYFVLKDDVALRGPDIENPQQGFDEAGSGGGSGQPLVTFEFSRKGAAAFRALSREVARRGRRVAAATGRGAADANQHFAIALDDRIVSLPYIDFRANRNGIRSRGSQIQGGFTIATARQLATVLSTGALEVPLELIAEKRSP